MSEITTEPPKARSTMFCDLMASVVVFLVALPLCIGVAIASGLEPGAGVITGIVGGLIVSLLGGAQLQVTGPTISLALLMLQILHQLGLERLGETVIAAGLIQLVGGKLGLARWFRAVPPSVVSGMLCGIGVLIFASQFHVMVDDLPKTSGLDNLLSIPSSVYKGLIPGTATHHNAAMLGMITISSLLLWNKANAKQFKSIPGSVVAICIATLMSMALGKPVKHVALPSNLLDCLHPISLQAAMRACTDPVVWLYGSAAALIASSETLLTAAGLDKLTKGAASDYNREMMAQGAGNVLCGFLGALPLTGVIVRSRVNFDAGAKTRLSSFLHGCWLLLFVALFPAVINTVPTSALAALLVFTGWKLADLSSLRELGKFGRGEQIIFVATATSIVGIDLLTGVAIGIGLSILKLVYSVSNLDVRITHDAGRQRCDLYLFGAATFVSLPKLSEALDTVDSAELHVHLDGLQFIDHACFDALINWEDKQRANGATLVIDWDAVGATYRDRRRISRGSGGREFRNLDMIGKQPT